jgi:hypothetical protein
LRRAAQFITQIASPSHGSRVFSRRCATSAERPKAAMNQRGKITNRIRVWRLSPES